MTEGQNPERNMIHSDSLVEKARKGDEKAISKLVSLWHKRIYNFCMKYFGDHDLATEATQQTFISMYKSIRSLKETSYFKSWLYRIAVNQCHDEDRRRKRHMSISYSSFQDEEEDRSAREVVDTQQRPDEKLHHAELNAMLYDCFQEMPAEQREVLIMKEFEGMKFREIATVLKVSENTVKSRLYYGLGHLRKILKSKNITKDSVYYG